MKIKINNNAKKGFQFYYYDLKNPLERLNLFNYYIGKATILDFFRSYLFDNPKLNFVQRIKRKDQYFIIRRRNRILSLGRICFKNTEEIELGLFEASLVSFFTVPKYRNRGFYKILMKEMMIYLKKKGYKLCIIWTSENNIPSKKAIERMGFKKIKQ